MITIVHNNNKKQLLVSTKTMEKLLERIAKDGNSVAPPLTSKQGFKDQPKMRPL